MISAAWAWLRSRAWARWLAIAVGALLAGAAAYLRGQRVGAQRERDRAAGANGRALGDELRAEDELAARDRERAEVEAETKRRIEAEARARLDHPPKTLADAKREERERAERLLRAEADE